MKSFVNLFLVVVVALALAGTGGDALEPPTILTATSVASAATGRVMFPSLAAVIDVVEVIWPVVR